MRASRLFSIATLIGGLAVSSPVFSLPQISDTVPPSTPAPDSTARPESKPGSSGVAKPGVNAPGMPVSAPGSAGFASMPGDDFPEDPSRWDLWWQVNSSQYLSLSASVRRPSFVQDDCGWFLGKGDEREDFSPVRPTQKQIGEEVVPALLSTLAGDCSDELANSTLTALAKIGWVQDLPNGTDMAAVIRPLLGHDKQSVSETAALALGILGGDSSSDLLLALMDNEPQAKQFTNRPAVPFRTRAFAAYALGLIGRYTSDNELRKQIATRLAAVLSGPTFSLPDLKIAAMVSFGLTPVDPGSPAGGAKAIAAGTIQTRQDQLAFLMEFIDSGHSGKRSKKRQFAIWAQAPTALARLLNRNGLQLNQQREAVIQTLLNAIGKHSKIQRNVQQSCILALGQLSDARGGSGVHHRIHAELERISKSGEEQAKRYALISLAQIAARPAPAGVEDPIGARASIQKVLVTRLVKSKGRLAPWAGLAVGVHARALIDNGQETLDIDVLIALRSAAKASNSPEFAGAYMIALGLTGDREVRDLILEKMEQFSVDKVRGHCAIALGLMNEVAAVEAIQDMLVDSKFRPGLMHQAVMGLGLLGDQTTAEFLLYHLTNSKSASTQTALASALGALGDARSIKGLVALLADPSQTHTARASAAMALGMICDKSLLPWNAYLQMDSNYMTRASTFTNTQGSGVLDR